MRLEFGKVPVMSSDCQSGTVASKVRWGFCHIGLMMNGGKGISTGFIKDPWMMNYKYCLFFLIRKMFCLVNASWGERPVWKNWVSDHTGQESTYSRLAKREAKLLKPDPCERKPIYWFSYIFLATIGKHFWNWVVWDAVKKWLHLCLC